MYACQIYQAAAKELPGLEAQLAAGDFKGLKAWLNERIHKVGVGCGCVGGGGSVQGRRCGEGGGGWWVVGVGGWSRGGLAAGREARRSGAARKVVAGRWSGGWSQFPARMEAASAADGRATRVCMPAGPRPLSQHPPPQVGSLHNNGDELMEQVTGAPLDPAVFLAYLRAKYSELYKL
jgi:hypothetical protein